MEIKTVGELITLLQRFTPSTSINGLFVDANDPWDEGWLHTLQSHNIYVDNEIDSVVIKLEVDYTRVLE